ncbi:ABC-type dipeptide/oligopeptide/nickel transport system, permease component [Clostridium aceticum]|uniref:ABC-type dipeptide/oligopeptide/nickel transport system, permease component n=1 Tax=Clostridium aceticum TaxID=84022 RepID=A0A0G3WDA1_9CLOT|nr:nickel transporter permease [Clostridium aceticum]AKL96333.1 ABC-type dipeptide/oligopeptide/nickel transport system, permease component [Clostridium aceticum]
MKEDSCSFLRNVLQSPMTMTGIIMLLVIIFLTLFGPSLVTNDALTVQMSERLLGSSWQYPLGTDHMGRCIFVRLVSGARVTLGIAALVIITVMIIGIPLGLICGYVGGKIDTLVMRIVDGASALPEFLLAIAIAGFLGPSLNNVMLSIVFFKWIGYTRVVRSIVLSEREKEYVLAARVAGSSTRTIIWRHLLPQVISPVMVLAAMDVGKVILTISSLSYLGLGAQPPTPEWGAMLNDGRPYFQTVPQLMIYPGLAIILVVVSCNLISDGLRDLLDVHTQKNPV